MSTKQYWWFFFGIYGLEITDDIWSKEKMLFGDATIAAANTNLYQEIKQIDEEKQIVFESVIGIRPWKDTLGIDMSSVKFGSLIQQPIPNSFIVIKRRKKASKQEVLEDALSRAKEIAAMLTIARSHNSMSVEGFIDVSGLERSPIIGVIPYSWLDEESGQIEAQHKFYNGSWLRQPDTFSLEQLFDSFEKGNYLQTTDNKFWSIHSEDHFISTIRTFNRSSAQKRLVRAAVHLYEAHHAPTPEQRLTQSVTSLEMLFPGSTNFSLLTQRLKALLIIDSTSHEIVDRIMKLRHGYVHNGDKIDSPSGNLALGIASMTMYCFAEAISSFGNIEALVDRLDLIASVQMSSSLSEEDKQLLIEKIGNITKITKEKWIKLRAIEKVK